MIKYFIKYNKDYPRYPWFVYIEVTNKAYSEVYAVECCRTYKEAKGYHTRYTDNR